MPRPGNDSSGGTLVVFFVIVIVAVAIVAGVLAISRPLPPSRAELHDRIVQLERQMSQLEARP